MDRRKMMGALGGIGAGIPLAGAASAAGHGNASAAAGPMTGPHAHFCGIHMFKKNPKLQFITQHYCAAHSKSGQDDIFQCVLFDSTASNAKLIGVEYLISEAMYQKLPDEEKKYWHAHTYEVLGGGLIAPAMNAEDEMKFMKMVMPMWGKAWHTWPDPESTVPMGEPMLIWSLMGDGQVDPKVIKERDTKFKVSEKAIREKRAKEIGLAAPKVSVPKDYDTIGRQWTDSGEDKPTQLP